MIPFDYYFSDELKLPTRSASVIHYVVSFQMTRSSAEHLRWLLREGPEGWRGTLRVAREAPRDPEVFYLNHLNLERERVNLYFYIQFY